MASWTCGAYDNDGGRVAKAVGIGWMALVGALGAWLGLSEAFLGAPGLIFKGGYGEVYLLAALFFSQDT